MRVIVKHPDAAPFTLDIGPTYDALRAALGATPGSCISHPGVRVWCDDEYMRKDPMPPLNLIRPTDEHRIHGTVIVTGEDGPEMRDLDDRQVALWIATLSLISAPGAWRSAELLADLASKVHDVDAAMYELLRASVARSRR